MFCHKHLVNYSNRRQGGSMWHNPGSKRHESHGTTRYDSSQHRIFSKKGAESVLAWLEYLCSCFHPTERHSFVCRCTPETCWCTCYCDKRMHHLHKELKHNHRWISVSCKKAETAGKSITVRGNWSVKNLGWSCLKLIPFRNRYIITEA